MPKSASYFVFHPNQLRTTQSAVCSKICSGLTRVYKRSRKCDPIHELCLVFSHKCSLCKTETQTQHSRELFSDVSQPTWRRWVCRSISTLKVKGWYNIEKDSKHRRRIRCSSNFERIRCVNVVAWINSMPVIYRMFASKKQWSPPHGYVLRVGLLKTTLALCTISPKGILQFWSCNKAVANVFPHKAEPSSATRTGQYLLDC